MTVTAATSFDLEAFRAAYEAWDTERLLAMYADDVELILVDELDVEHWPAGA